MHPLKKAARVAGLFYLVVVIAGPFTLLYVPGKLFVPGNASATAAKILEHLPLFRADIVLSLVSELFFLLTVLALFRLLKGVNLELAALMVILVLIDVPLAFLGTANQVATLKFLTDPGFLSVFDPPQRDALTLLLTYFDKQGVFVSELFWGLWLLPLGVLVYKSRFLPRFLGAWLFANGLAYLALSTTGILWPGYSKGLMSLMTPFLLGEMALMLWLITVGARVPEEPGRAQLA
ncbi:MAG TPA: DUF4386 domain-containing protein [Thermoanaerobaculia bacterium]|nr:DUF4386 domain-containing protein [Thermoanaerobaculia bacterium]